MEEPATAARPTELPGATVGVRDDLRRFALFRRMAALVLSAVRHLFTPRDEIADYKRTHPERKPATVPLHLEARMKAKRIRAARKAGQAAHSRLRNGGAA